MRVELPEFTSKKEAFKYLRENNKTLIAQKKSLPIKSEVCDFGCDSIEISSSYKETRINLEEKEYTITAKQKAEEIGQKASINQSLREDEIGVKAYANVIGWCDSHMDVLIRDCAKKSITDKGASNQVLFYHLKDHIHSSSGIIGRKAYASLEDVKTNKFNVNSDVKNTQAIMGHSIIAKRYDEKCYYLYSDDEVKQHSIGLQYVKLFLCFNSEDPEDSQYKENWDKYYPDVINKEKVDQKGYFWAVTQIKLMEFSAVLFGSNELTPTEEVSKASKDQPSEDTGKQTESKSSKDTDSEKRKLILLYS